MAALSFLFWYWWVLAIVFLIAEMLVSGFFFLWLAAAAFLNGLIFWLLPAVTLDIQVLVFSLSAIVALVAWKSYAKKIVIHSDQPLLNQRGAQYIGRVFSLYEAIENGQGKIRADDSIWKVYGEDCPMGTKVKVVAVNGTVFEVQAVHSAPASLPSQDNV
jgi:hypothetical protein